MKIEIAGYNLDYTEIQKLPDQKRATPETISAAYARISRSSKSVGELRMEALEDVARSRSSNENIIFEMGHASVAEHAVFNFDITGISRLLVEEVQRSRLASFTEKSQRYVTLDGDFVLPGELCGSDLEQGFCDLIADQNRVYRMLYERGRDHLKREGFVGGMRELRGKAKEDARYVLSLATETQFGMTINARSLERLLQRLDRSPLQEAQELKTGLRYEAVKIAPSLVRYTECEEFERGIKYALPERTDHKFNTETRLLQITPEADNWILAGLMFECSGGDVGTIFEEVKKLSESEKHKIFRSIFEHMQPWHRVPRSFELVAFTFSLLVSSSCFGQLKRHRMSTILRTGYHPGYGYVIPPLLEKIGGREIIEPLMRRVEKLFYQMEEKKQGLGSYILTNSHRMPVLFQSNLRELYHFSRLRSDSHAQWEIREVSERIDKLVRKSLPCAGMMIMGKDEFIKNLR